jgi:hypothetical protein
MRRHAPAQRFPPRDALQVRSALACELDRGGDRSEKDRARVGAARALLDVRELIAESRDPSLRETPHDRVEERLPHPRAGPVRDDVHRLALRREPEERAHVARALADAEAKLLVGAAIFSTHVPISRAYSISCTIGGTVRM